MAHTDYIGIKKNTMDIIFQGSVQTLQHHHPGAWKEYDENEELTIIVGSSDQLDRMVYDAVMKHGIIFSTAGLKGILILLWAIDLAISDS